MPVASATNYVKNLIDQLPLPPPLPPLAAYVNPPDPNAEGGIPAAYIWAPAFTESRGQPGGTIPRNTGPGTPSGFKPVEHHIEVFLVFFQASDEPQADTLFFGIVDAVMLALRTSADPVPVTDPYTGQVSTLIDVGEVMRGRTTIRATASQAWNRLDGLLTLTVHELIQA